MSKPVRIKEYLADQVEVLAGVERRSFANMVEVLLLAALTERGKAGHDWVPVPESRSVSADEPRRFVEGDRPAKPHPKGGR